MKLIAIAAASAMFMAGAAQAQMVGGAGTGTTYGELGYSSLKVSGGGFSAKPGMLRGVVGYNLGENLALEGMLGLGIRKDSSTTTFNGVAVKVDQDVRHMIGIYVKPKVMLANSFELYGRLGYVDTRLRSSASVAGFSASGSSSGSDVSYGLGVNFNVAPRAYVGVDYMSYYKKDDVKIDGLTVSVGYRF